MRFFQRTIRPGEGRLVVTLMALLALNTLVLELAEVVATAGFISNVGTPQIIGLWVVDMVITLIAASGFALVVDHTQRIRLVARLLLGFSGCYFALLGLFVYGTPDWLNYTLLYILADQQYVVFPLAFWALANDLFAVSEGKRLFPLIAIGAALGNLLGNGLAAISALLLPTSQSALGMLVVCVTLCLMGWLLVWWALRRRDVRARQSKTEGIGVRETLRVGGDMVQNVPLFRFLALAMMMVGIGLTIIEYHFMLTIDTLSANDPAWLQSMYALYKIALVVTTMLVQWLLTSRWMERVGIKSTFTLLPVTVVIALAGTVILPTIGGLAGRFISRLIQAAWDEPARKSAQGLVPDERRGRVSVFLDSYCYSLATLVGCAVLGLIVGFQKWGWLVSGTLPYIYLSVGLLATGVGLWAALRIRRVYDSSLLNWRLARSRRRSVLDGIEF